MTPDDLDPPQFMPKKAVVRPSATGARRVGATPDQSPLARPDSSTPRSQRPVRAPSELSHRPISPARRATRTPAASVAEAPSAPPEPSARQRPSTNGPSGPMLVARPTSALPPDASEHRGPQPPAGGGRTAGARRRARRLPIVVALVLALLMAWPFGLMAWANGKIVHTSALSGAPGTPGTTYLLVGSDSRADGTVTDGAAGQRSDTILVLHVASNGQAAMISLPRDTYVQIEGYGGNKLNASYSFGGGPLLVSTVESLTGLTVDHYVEIGMGGVVTVVDAVDGVDLCLDYDVNDDLSGLVWTAGCHDVDGSTALAFARMRYSDPLGDIGRQTRQRQVVAAVVREAATPATALNPVQQVRLIDAGTGALATDAATGIVDLARLALAFRSATGADGITGAPPIADFDYHPGGVGSTVLLDEALGAQFFQRLRDGDLTSADIQQWG